MSQEVLTRVEGGVLTITFNRPERKNAITTAMYRALTDALAGADGDRAVRTVVLEGHESVFTAGNDLEEPRMFGHHRAAAALLLGEPLNAQAALEAGLVNQVLPAADVNAFAQQQARKAASKALGSLLETKRLMKHGEGADVLQRIDDESSIFRRMLGEPAAKEAISAFLGKRKPDFSML
jgi:enoyl-CoA hydratase/carnithine racemase